MTIYGKRFKKIITEQDREEIDVNIDVDDGITDQEAADAQLDTMDSSELGSSEVDTSTAMTDQQRMMYDELKEWIHEMDKFANYLNGTNNSITTTVNSAESDTLFSSIANAETKKMARVSMEVMSLSEMLKGYLAGANDPKYRFN